MALPTLKNEHFSSSRNHREYDASAHSNADSDVRPVAIVHGKKNRLALGHDEESSVSTGIKRVCISNDREVSNAESRFSVSTANSSTRDSMFECNHEDCVNSLRCSRHSNSAPELRPAHQNSSDSSPSPTSPSALTAMLSGSNSDDGPTDARRKRPQDCSFAYTLQAATSVATKVNEETMTYLNQGQSYEIKLKKKSGQAGKKVRTIVRVGFYERRLQYMETVLIEQWRASRRSERILEVDVPLSYGISDIINDAVDINKCSFVWDTAKDCGIFIKVNCISTEFTPKKHGGEKGVPFRIIIETHSLIPSGKTGFETILHAASSQVKVFKPKGADRKHKTDREKLMRKGNQEAEKFRASYDYTKFTECSTDQIYVTTTPANITHSRHSSIGSQNSPERHVPAPDMVDSPLDFTSARLVIEDVKSPSTPTAAAPVSRFSVSPLSQAATSTSPSALSPQPLPSSFLRADATAAEAAQWLMTCRFEKYVKTFAHFSGSDILRLTRSDLIQICDLTDGIRLYNSLHCQSLRPRSTIYVSTSPNEDFSAIYLESLTAQELKSKLCNLLSSNMSNGCNGKSSNGTASQPVVSISRMRMAGPAGIFIAVTDDVVRNIPHEAMFMLDFEKGLPFLLLALRV